MDLRDRAVGLAADLALGVVLVSALAVTAVAVAVSWGGAYWAFGGAAGAVVGVIALLRRQDRARAAVAGLAVAAVAVVVARLAGLPAEPGPAMVVGLAVLVCSAVRALPARTACAVAAGGVAVVAANWLTSPVFPAGVPTTVTTLNGVAWLAALALGLGLRLLDAGRRDAVERIRREERLEVARELHDVVAHHITGIVLQAQAARIVRRKAPDLLDDSLAGIEAAGSEGMAALRRVVGLLRDADAGAPATHGPDLLGDLVGRFEGPAVDLRLPVGDPVWPPEVAGAVYRVVRESLTNVARHAPAARSVSVDVSRAGRAITVEVVDDGPPVHARYHRRPGYGLVGMRERVEALGGTLCAGPLPGAGWSVRAVLPVDDRTPR
ncbi:sensor histidine kinase [Saccharothrix sp. NRRL B-16314]|uniref:sensor histidine kinase n=1 Tax=Saccharothrix sp. NRRL B-16314 TaxID=1463825 RepID=UPI0005263C4A|nr:histidine kinase [Saccharothrix sp. NRRL B-16314]